MMYHSRNCQTYILFHLVQEDQHSPTHVSKYKIFFSIRDLIFKVITKQEDCHYL